jgi:hypothetical protein
VKQSYVVVVVIIIIIIIGLNCECVWHTHARRMESHCGLASGRAVPSTLGCGGLVAGGGLSSGADRATGAAYCATLAAAEESQMGVSPCLADHRQAEGLYRRIGVRYLLLLFLLLKKAGQRAGMQWPLAVVHQACTPSISCFAQLFLTPGW